MARGTTARVRRGAEATWQSHGWPTRGAGGAQGAATWQGAMHPRGSTWVPEWGTTWQRVGRWRAHGIVGPGKIVGGSNAKALHRPLIYTRYSSPFPPCGTMVPRSLTFAGHEAAQRTSDAWALMEIRQCGGHGVHPIPI